MLTIGPLWEELYFRELLIGRLSNYIPKWVCLLVSLILFTIIHLNYPLFALFSGIIYTLTYFYTKSLGVTIITHVLWNAYIVLEGIW